MVLPERQAVGMPRWKVADVERRAGEPGNLHDLSLRKKPVSDAALIEDLDRPRVQAASTRAGEVLARAPLHDGDVDARQGQLAREHQPCRTTPCDHHCMLGHCHPAARIARVASGASLASVPRSTPRSTFALY